MAATPRSPRASAASTLSWPAARGPASSRSGHQGSPTPGRPDGSVRDTNSPHRPTAASSKRSTPQASPRPTGRAAPGWTPQWVDTVARAPCRHPHLARRHRSRPDHLGRSMRSTSWLRPSRPGWPACARVFLEIDVPRSRRGTGPGVAASSGASASRWLRRSDERCCDRCRPARRCCAPARSSHWSTTWRRSPSPSPATTRRSVMLVICGGSTPRRFDREPSRPRRGRNARPRPVSSAVAQSAALTLPTWLEWALERCRSAQAGSRLTMRQVVPLWPLPRRPCGGSSRRDAFLLLPHGARQACGAGSVPSSGPALVRVSRCWPAGGRARRRIRPAPWP